MALRVIHPGTLATVQDRGRTGARSVGVPVGGAFDTRALLLANALVGNPPDAAALELTGLGGSYEAEVPLLCALAGAAMRLECHGLDGSVRRLEPPVAFPVPAGGRIVLGGAAHGARAVLAVRGGFPTDLVLGSRSSETPLRAGDRLPARPAVGLVRRFRDDSHGSIDTTGAPVTLRVLDGPDAGPEGPRPWDGLSLRVSDAADRMGVRLDGPPVPGPERAARGGERLSAPVAPGAVQWVEGRLIVLGVAAGTMGGYPHVAQLITADLDRLAQLRPGDAVRFERINLPEARRLDREDRRQRHALWLRLTALAAEGVIDLPVGPDPGA